MKKEKTVNLIHSGLRKKDFNERNCRLMEIVRNKDSKKINNVELEQINRLLLRQQEEIAGKL